VIPLIIQDQLYTIKLESSEVPYSPKPVTGQEPFFAVSYSKPALGWSRLFWYGEIKTSIMKFAHCAASAVKSSDNDAGEVHSRTTCPSQLLRT
jgi:hypothetical protein